MNKNLPADLIKRLQEPLPGARAFNTLAPELSYGRHAGPAPHDARRAAVMLLLYPYQDQWYVPLTLRPDNLANHAGQISLPGGMIEYGESTQAAAKRELIEELGPPGQIKFLGRLSEFYVWVSNFLVTPWVAYVKRRPNWVPNPAEVQEVIELPVEHLLDLNCRGEIHIRRHTYQLTAPCYNLQEHQIWGATGMILSELASLVGELQAASAEED